jgi:serine/threonine protein kinase
MSNTNIHIDLFEIITTLGYGTFGRVKLVRLKNTREVFALKIMKKIDIIKQKQVDHIKSEKEILMELDHPFIVSLY